MKTKFTLNPKTWLFLIAALTVIVCFLGARPLLGTARAAQIELIGLGVLALTLLGVILFLLVSLLALIFSKNRANWLERLRGQMVFMLSVFILLAVIVSASQWMAHTPPIVGQDGKPLPNSIGFARKNKTGRRRSMADRLRRRCQ